VDVDFYLYFPSEDGAQNAADALRAEAYAVETRLGADDVNWLALATRSLSDDDLDAAEERLSELAELLGGEYDGFEREVD